MTIKYTILLIVFLLFSCKEEQINPTEEHITTNSACDSELIKQLRTSPSDSCIRILNSLNYKETNISCELERLAALTFSYSNLNRLDSVDIIAEKGLKLAREIKDSAKIIDFICRTAYAKSQKNQTDVAINYLTEGLAIGKKINSKKLYQVYDKIAMAYYIDRDFETSKKYFNESLRLIESKETIDSSLLSKTLSNKANYFTFEKKHDSAVWILKRAINYINPADNMRLGRAYQHLAGSMASNDNHDGAMNAYKTSLYYHKKANTPTTSLQYNMGVTQAHQQYYKEAEKHYFKSYEESTKMNDTRFILLTLEQLIYVNKKQGKYEKALDYLVMLNDANKKYDSIHEEETLDEFKVKYDVMIKEEQNESLALENQVISQSNQNKNLIIIIIVGFVTVLFVFLWFIYKQNNYRKQLENVELEQKLLRSQMNPHFIFNSISTIHSLITAQENKKAAKYLSKFSKLMRLTLENSRDKFVPLSDELLALENYISIQKLRFQNKFDHIINIDPSIESEYIGVPPMLIQPFIENAIEHGLRNLDYTGLIKISIQKNLKTNSISCVIDDNGVGINQSKEFSHQSTSQKKKSLSTEITRERLAILAKQTKTLSNLSIIQKKEENGTKVNLDIPYIDLT